MSRAFFHRADELVSDAIISDDEKHARFKSVHNDITGHHGVQKTMDVLKAAALSWPGYKQDISEFIKQCLICQKFKYGRHESVGDSTYHIHGTFPMQSLSIDSIGPLPEDQFGNKYIIGIVDNFSKFINLFATPSTTALEYVNAIIKHIGIFGIPKSIRTDGGTQFTASVCEELSRLLKFDHLVIVPYHPQANGMIERRNAEVMKHLRILVFNRDVGDTWSNILPLVQRILNFTRDGSVNVAPSQIVFGDMLSSEISIILPSTDGTIVVSDYLRTLTENQFVLI